MSAPVHLGRHTLGGSVLVFLAEALLLPTGLLTAAFLTRRLGPDDYGLFVLSVSLVSWIEWTVTSVFGRPTIKFVADAEVDDWRPVAATVVQLHLGVGVGVALLLALLAGPIGMMLNEPALVGYLQLFALEIPLFIVAHAHRNILVGRGRFAPRALMGASRWLVRLALMVCLVELGLSVPGAILGSIGATLAELAIGRFYVQPSLFGRFRFPIREFCAYAMPLFLFAVSLRIFDKLDLFALKALGGTAAQAGIYGAAQNLALVPGIFALSISPLLLSSLTRALRSGDVRATRAIGRDAMRVTIMVLPLAGLLAGAAPEIVHWIYGPLFLSAAPILALLVFGAVALVMISTATAILTAAGKPGWTFALTGPLLPLAIVGDLLLIPPFGPIGAALVTCLVATGGALAAVWAVHRLWRILPPLATLWRSAVLAVGAYALGALWAVDGMLLLVKLSVLAGVALLGFFALGEFSTDEIALARSTLRWRAVLRPATDRL